MTQPPYGQQPQQQPPPPPQGQSYNPQQSPQQSPQQYPPQGQGYGAQSGQSYPPTASTATSTGTFNATVAVFAAIAAVLAILSLFVFGWFRDNFNSVSGGSSSSSESKFSKLHDSLSHLKDQVDAQPTIGKYLHFGISPTYFGWLGYVLIIAAVVLTFICAAPLGGGVVAVKAFSALVALVGLGLTLWAIDLISVDQPFIDKFAQGKNAPSYFDYIKHTSFGAWAMLLAFLLCLIGSLLPPKRKTVVTTSQPTQY